MLHREFYRQGPRHAHGDVSFVDIRQRFDFRSIQIGKWVTKAEQQKAAQLFYDALCDLMTILGGNETLVSLRGTLALQYGTGGQRGVMAHYEPSTRCFSLAKNAGPGSIAHEWFHGFDHYICEKAFGPSSNGQFASEAWLDDREMISHPLNDALSNMYQTIILNEAGDAPSEYFERSAMMDKQTKTYYFSKPEELCARAFEAFIQDAPIKNNFLVKGTKASQEAQLGLYPEDDHRARINAAFREYFHQLGGALKRQEAQA